jgi:DNA-binding NarL/FixJ family response regulator
MDAIAAATQVETAKMPTDPIVHILGEKSLNTELLVDFMHEKLEFACRFSPRDELTSVLNQFQARTHLALVDGNGNCESIFSKLPDLNNGHHVPGCHVILYDVDRAQCIEPDALRRGIRGILYAQQPIEFFPRAVRAVLNGELWYPRRFLNQFIVAEDDHSNPTAEACVLLTRRERQIVARLAKGWTNRKIARDFRISINTVKTHLYNIYKKIRVGNRFQAIVWLTKGAPTRDREVCAADTLMRAADG